MSLLLSHQPTRRRNSRNWIRHGRPNVFNPNELAPADKNLLVRRSFQLQMNQLGVTPEDYATEAGISPSRFEAFQRGSMYDLTPEEGRKLWDLALELSEAEDRGWMEAKREGRPLWLTASQIAAGIEEGDLK